MDVGCSVTTFPTTETTCLTEFVVKPITTKPEVLLQPATLQLTTTTEVPDQAQLLQPAMLQLQPTTPVTDRAQAVQLPAVVLNPKAKPAVVARSAHQVKLENQVLTVLQEKTERQEKLDSLDKMLHHHTNQLHVFVNVQSGHQDQPDRQATKEAKDIQESKASLEPLANQDRKETPESKDHKDHLDYLDAMARKELQANTFLVLLRQARQVVPEKWDRQAHQDSPDLKERTEKQDLKDHKETKAAQAHSVNQAPLVVLDRPEMQEHKVRASTARNQELLQDIKLYAAERVSRSVVNLGVLFFIFFQLISPQIAITVFQFPFIQTEAGHFNADCFSRN